MLPAAHRLRDGAAFGTTVRSGRRAGCRTLVVHCVDAVALHGQAHPARVGFVVSRAVGDAVARNRVKRRLRHLVRDRLELLPAGSTTVVRALPAAAAASTARLDDDLARCLERALREREASPS